MGLSTDAILCYGIALDDDESWEVHDVMGVEEYDNDEFCEWLEKINEELEAVGLYIDSHCSAEYPMYYICVHETAISANRGYPQIVTMERIGIINERTKEKWDKKLKEACKQYNFPYKNPEWLLMSDMH